MHKLAVWRSFSTILAGTIILFLSICFYEDGYFRHKIEMNVFSYYPQSVLEDGDLNIINQVESKMSWLATKTFNHPDIRENGSFALQLPFYATSQLFKGWDSEFKRISHFDFAQAAANLFFSLFSLFLMFKILRFFKVEEFLGYASIIFIFFGTPVFYYTFFEYSGADIMSMFCTSAFLYILLCYPNKFAKPILLGLVWSLGFLTKTTVAFILPSYLLIELFVNAGSFYDKLKRLTFFFLFAGLLFLFNYYNHIMQWGFYFNPYSFVYLNYFKDFVGLFNPEVLFGTTGYFFTAPLLIVILLFSVIQLFKVKDKLIWILNLNLLILFLYNGLRPFPEELFSSRVLISYTGYFVLVLAIALKNTQNKKLQFSFLSLLTLYHLFLAVTYFSAGPGYLSLLESNLFGVVHQVAKTLIQQLWISTRYLQLLGFCLIFSIVLFFLKLLIQRNHEKFLNYSIFSFAFLFIFCSTLNLINNQKNVSALKNQGFFTLKVIGNGKSIYLYDDILSVTPKILKKAFDEKNSGRVEQIKLLEEKYLQAVRTEIVEDPIGFTANLNFEHRRRSFWDSD